MVSLQPHLTSLLKSLPPSPIEQSKLDELVKSTLARSRDSCSSENRKLQWEYALKNDIFELAMTEGVALKADGAKYYDDLRGKLDLSLTFTEQDACEQVFPFTVLQDLLETQTITSCSQIFSWIEMRTARLTKDMVPQKGKALILLRTLNDLLRRLSKMGTNTIFCGRILTFLSGVFPLGERSGVNLRGEYGPTWEGVRFKDKAKSENDDKDQEMKTTSETVADDEKMQVDDKNPPVAQTPEEKKEEFYNTFWALQLPFSKPPIFATKDSFPNFKDAINKVMPVIKEATAKERAMMGSRSVVGAPGALKRKREPDEETNSNEYFFAKFLTSPDLLDLEIADTHFRRQFLFQLLILLNHLLGFTATAKAAWTTPRNRSLQMDFTLEEADAQWVQESLTKIFEELRQTTPNGRVFADTVHAILERERNWVKWKNELCTPFDKEPWTEQLDGKKVGLFEITQSIRDEMRLPPEEWKWTLGTEALTEIWEMGYRDLQDLQSPVGPGDVRDFVKKIKLEDGKINLRKKQLERITLARMKQNAAMSAASHPPTPAQETSAGSKPDTTATETTTNASTLAAPRPVTGTSNSPLHPSLPAKPGSPSKPANSSQEPVRTDTATPTHAQATSVIAASAPTPAPAATAVATPVPMPVDPEISKFEDNKQRWAWLALRAARDQYLQHFGKIGTGDIEALAQEIEKEKSMKGDDNTGGSTGEEHGAGSPSILGTENSESSNGKDVEMDA